MTRTVVLLLSSSDPLHHNYDFPVLSLPNGFALITNHLLMMLAVTLIMLFGLPMVARRIATGRSGTSHDYVTKGSLPHMVEVICVFLRNEVAKPVLGRNTDKFMPYIWTVFFFILLNNLIGMVPLFDLTALLFGETSTGGQHETATLTLPDNQAIPPNAELLSAANPEAQAGAEGGHEPNPATDSTHQEDEASGGADDAGGLIWFHDLTKGGRATKFEGIGGTATGNIAVTFTLALIAICVIIGSGIKSLGIRGFLRHLTLDAPIALWPLTFLLEIIGLMAKPFALMVRLFANMTAGHVMLAALLGFCSMAWNGLAVLPGGGTSVVGAVAAILISIASIIFAVAIGLLELLVAVIQAYIFAFLTTMFISMFQHQEHEHHDQRAAAATGTLATAHA